MTPNLKGPCYWLLQARTTWPNAASAGRVATQAEPTSGQHLTNVRFFKLPTWLYTKFCYKHMTQTTTPENQKPDQGYQKRPVLPPIAKTSFTNPSLCPAEARTKSKQSLPCKVLSGYSIELGLWWVEVCLTSRGWTIDPLQVTHNHLADCQMCFWCVFQRLWHLMSHTALASAPTLNSWRWRHGTENARGYGPRDFK